MSDMAGEMPNTPAAQSDANQNATPAQADGEAFDAARAMALIEKLRTQVKELTPKAKQAEQLAAAVKAKEEAEMTEIQKLSKRLTEAESELKATRHAAQASDIAAKVGLPAALADRLKGETPEEMEADAKAILDALPKTETKKPQPGPVINPGANGQPGETAAQMRQRITGVTPFEGPFARGGGVVGG
jgi:hypothetical protein